MPDDGWVAVDILLEALTALKDPVWLVIDDLHELRSPEALRQMQQFLRNGPDGLRIILSARRDVPLGLHRLRLEGEVTDIRAADLRFVPGEARELFAAAGIHVSDPALTELVDHAEGWAAGLGLAALSLAGHPDPERFAAEFSGRERTVAEYLLAEVLERQSEQVRWFLLRTSVCERLCGELADLLTDGSGGERILQDLEDSAAFVDSLDGQRSWFRYHRLFADLLRLELRRSAPEELPALHAAAAQWLAEHGHSDEAIRHAEASGDLSLATRLLSDSGPGPVLDGRTATADEHMNGPLEGTKRYLAEGVAALWSLRLDEAERCLEYAERGLRNGISAAEGVLLCYARGLADMARGRYQHAVEAFQTAERLGGAQPRSVQVHAFLLLAFVRSGDTQRAERALSDLDDQQRASPQMRVALAGLRLAQGKPEAATAAVASILEHPSAPADLRGWFVQAFLLEAIARDSLGERTAAERALERALDLAEPHAMLLPFLLHPAPALAHQHHWRQSQHATAVARILSLQAGVPKPALPLGIERGRLERPARQLSESEIRVLRYLPTNMTAPEIARELCLSVHTVTTHIRHLYEKLDVHRRRQAVERARVLGLLATSENRL
ncbi:MAG: LuxR C-terminal-related transcriptional regulator [Streptosporangiaceae bacterium]|jgi:ATP/maltotriose-dependent transcriptional regulator MalT